jgi:hypothetical protein
MHQSHAVTLLLEGTDTASITFLDGASSSTDIYACRHDLYLHRDAYLITACNNSSDQGHHFCHVRVPGFLWISMVVRDNTGSYCKLRVWLDRYSVVDSHNIVQLHPGRSSAPAK